MTAYIIRRLLWLPIILLVVTFLTFAIARFGPGDPLGRHAGKLGRYDRSAHGDRRVFALGDAEIGQCAHQQKADHDKDCQA